MSASALDIKKVAILARLDLTEQELAEFSGQLGSILHYVEKLNAVDVSGIEPTAHPSPVFDVLRPDTARPGFGVENALLNAPKAAQSQIQVPKVVE
jgi:aspartyl-tRNA(Asn)/glutamyl-tRNA(Gln) amidotransferase subunit C